MEARIAPIKSTSPKIEQQLNSGTDAAVERQSLRRSGSREFVNMALAAIASGVVFGIVSGLVVWLVASHQQFEGAGDTLAQSAPQVSERSSR